MCGIAGFLGSVELDPQRIDECLRAMRHRGPDAAGRYHHSFAPGRHVHLLHTRLSIIDLDQRANQPFRIGSAVMTYNGELYNYRELARDLGPDVSLTTTSDTEVLLEILVRRGWKGFDECEGMWALAVYDERDGSLMLSRDRFGEKPLYMLQTAEGLYFGSEIKFIRALVGKPLPVNIDHLCRYLVNGYKSLYKNGSDFFNGITSLPPGSVLLVDHNGRLRSENYWEPEFERDETMSYGEAVEQAKALLVRSVDLRLRADVPLAFLMSGGVDSNALISVARNVLQYDVHGFTITDDDPRYDERAMVERSVQALDIRHTAVPTDHGGFLENLRQLVRQHDAPVYTITYYAQWLLMKQIAAHGYRISISGTGADELFSGYYDHHNAYLFEVRNDPVIFDPALLAWQRHIQPIVRNPHLADPLLFVRQPEFRGHIFLDADVFSTFLREPWQEPFAEERYCEGVLRNRMLNELFHEAVPPILHEDDANAMSFSIENRSPFLDRRLFEFAQTIPTRHLIRDGFAKAVLRDAVRGIAPECVLNERRKVGFNAPIGSFLELKDPAVRAAVLEPGPIFDHVRRDSIERLLNEEHLANSRSKFLFYFLSAKMFLEEMAA